MKFENWLNLFFQEKGIDDYQEIKIKYNNNFHYLFVENVKEFLCQLPAAQQMKIKNTFIKIDILNGDIEDYIVYLAKGITQI